MSKKKIAIAAGAALLVAGVVATVAAQHHRRQHGGSQGPEFGGPAGYDGRGDMRGGGMFGRGPLTKDAFDTRTRERFAAIDKNSDGELDLAEIEASFTSRMGERMGRMGMRPDEMGERMMRRFDANKDGKVTKDEFLAHIRKAFAEMDLDNDGRITDDDLPPMMRGRNALAGGTGGGPGIGGRRGGGMGGPGLMGLLREADANKDGVVTLDEVLVVAERRFAALDRNKDASIDKADFDGLRKEMVDYRVKRFVHNFGADKEQKVTRDQFTAKAGERFARMDWNNDGSITRDEMPGGGMRRGGWRARGEQGGPEHGGRGMGPGGPGGPPPAEKK